MTLSLFSRWNSDTRLILLNKENTKNLTSVSNVYPNAVWLEREMGEMYDLSFVGLKDTRKLLLEYSTPRGILKSMFSNQANYNIKVKNTITTTFAA